MLTAKSKALHAGTKSAGLTLIEMLVTMAIAGILLGIAIPSFQSWNTGIKVRNAAENFQNGLRLAQSEALKRNTYVDMSWTSQAPVAASSKAGLTTNTTGPNWIIQLSTTWPTASPAYTKASSNFIQGYLGAEGGKNVSFSADSSTCPSFTTLPSTITFDGWGRMVQPSGICIKFTPTGATTPSFTVQATTGGKIRLCNPSKAAGDPQGCS